MAPVWSRVLATVGLLLGCAWADTECPTAPAVVEDRRSDITRLRVMQFNAEWLFVDTYGDCPGTGCPWPNSTVAWEHLEAIASVVAEYDPDIVNFCEIEGCDELNDLITVLGDSYNYKPYLKQGTDTATGQNVGMLTRVDPSEDLWRTSTAAPYPIDGSTCGYSGTAGVKSCSKHYFTSFDINGMKVAMIGAHLLAYPTDPSRCVQREAQATVLRSVIVDYMNQGYEVIVLGDFNDFDAQDVDTNDNIPTSQVLEILKGVNTTHELTNAAASMEKSMRYTDWWDENNDCVYEGDETSMIDHILLSKKLYDKLLNVMVAHAAYTETCDTLYSDHWPVVIDLTFSADESTDDDADDDDAALGTAQTSVILYALSLFLSVGLVFRAH